MSKFNILILLSFVIAPAAAQRCGVTGAINNTVISDAILETTTPNETIWDNPTYNVTGAASVSSPFLKYIDGLRWSTRYEYRASASFPSFVQTERALTIQRDVVFTCNDGSQQAYKFIFLVQDENTEAPQFNRASYNFTASLSQISNSSQPLNLNITVSDADVDIRNANVLIRSSNPYVTLLNIPLFENEIPDVAYIYRSELVIDWASLSPGTYQVILTADDGKYSALAYLNLNLNP